MKYEIQNISVVAVRIRLNLVKTIILMAIVSDPFHSDPDSFRRKTKPAPDQDLAPDPT